MRRCDDCGTSLVGLIPWREVIGFEQARSQGGTNHVALRQPTGKLICPACMSARQSGISTEQGQMAL